MGYAALFLLLQWESMLPNTFIPFVSMARLFILSGALVGCSMADFRWSMKNAQQGLVWEAVGIHNTTSEDISVGLVLEVRELEDGSSDTIELVVTTQPGLGTLTVKRDEWKSGRFFANYVPHPNVHGTDAFTYYFKRGERKTAPVVGQVLIEPVPDAPVAFDGNLNTDEEMPVNGQLRATDADADPVRFSIVSEPAKGVLSRFDPNTGSYLYSPNANETGMDRFSYKASDGNLESETKTITVNLSNVNDAPVASNLTFSQRHREPIRGLLSGTDIDGDALSVKIESLPKGGRFEFFPETNEFVFTSSSYRSPPGERHTFDIDTYTFTFSVSDGTARSNIASVTIHLLPQLEGTWSLDAQLRDRDETDQYRTAPCQPVELVIEHSSTTLIMPGYELVCQRGEVELRLRRPGISMQIEVSSYSDRLTGLTSDGVDTDGFVLTDLFGHVSLTFQSQIRMLWDFNVPRSHEKAPVGGMTFTELFNNQSVLGVLRRKTP
jgi:hypothetical protein